MNQKSLGENVGDKSNQPINNNSNIPLNNMSNNNMAQNQNNININNNSSNNNSNNVNINIEDIDTPEGGDDINKLIYSNYPQNINIQGEHKNDNIEGDVERLDGK